ncbi:SH3-domain kinase binding protein 1, partial [Elysia marginata]
DVPKPSKPIEPESAPEVHKREKQNTSERAVVRFSYTAEQPDELSLVEGQLVKVIEKHLDDEGWWKGEVNGKIGVFPDNFVELLPPDEPSKPKKPPPPSTASKQNLHSKLPIGDSADDNKKPESAAPAIGKKPQPPPPIGKKPASKPEPLKPSMVKSVSKDNNKDDRPTPEENTQFDGIDSSSPKLTHLTANRAKGPKKRPPSTVLTLNDMDKDGDSVDDAKHNSHHPPERPEKPHHVPPAKDNKHPPSEPEAPSLSHHQQPPHTVHTTSAVHRDIHHSGGSAPPRPSEPTTAPPQSSSASNAHTNKLIEQLQREIAELRANSVSKSAFNELKADYERLRSDFETMKTANSKKFRDLIYEVDEEKKLRLTTQVEIERVKKLVTETNV